MLIAENQSLPLVAAAMGHTNARMTLDKYAHLIDDARHAQHAPMSEVIEAARAEIREEFLRESFAENVADLDSARGQKRKSA